MCCGGWGRDPSTGISLSITWRSFTTAAPGKRYGRASIWAARRRPRHKQVGPVYTRPPPMDAVPLCGYSLRLEDVPCAGGGLQLGAEIRMRDGDQRFGPLAHRLAEQIG